jgi:hypothetical protein
MRYLIWLPVFVLATACNLDKQASGETGASSAAEKAGAAAPAAGEEKPEVRKVALDPLPLQIEAKPGGMGAMDMSMGDKKSVTVDIGGGASLNIQPTTETLAELKKGYEGDTIMFPFKKWEKEEANRAVLQFESEGKQGYIGFALLEVGKKAYVCKTTGLDGVASVELAEKHLEVCKTVSAK